MPELTAENARAIIEMYGRTMSLAAAATDEPAARIEAFASAAAAHGLEEPAFDWQAWEPFQAGRVTDHAFIAAADADTLRRIMTAHLRLNRFVEGHLDEMQAQGVIGAIVARLTRLAAEDAL